jgi:hypothetical protein
LAARLAGGFSSPVDMESLRAANQVALHLTALGEFDSIKLLPGMVDAAADRCIERAVTSKPLLKPFVD